MWSSGASTLLERAAAKIVANFNAGIRTWALIRRNHYQSIYDTAVANIQYLVDKKGRLNEREMKMKPEQRTALSAIVFALTPGTTTGKNNLSVFSHTNGGHAIISCELKQKQINAFDYGRGNPIIGSEKSKNSYSLFDFGTSNHIDLKINGTKFTGFDFESNTHFSGSIEGNSISLYDYAGEEIHEFSILSQSSVIVK